MLFLQGFHCFIICLLRHCSFFGFDCSIFCLLRNYNYYFFKVLLFRNLFVTSLLCSRLRLSPLLFVASAASLLFLQGFHCFIICLLRHCSFFGFRLFHLLFVMQLYYFFKFPLFHYLFVFIALFSASLFHLLIVTTQYYFFKASNA